MQNATLDMLNASLNETAAKKKRGRPAKPLKLREKGGIIPMIQAESLIATIHEAHAEIQTRREWKDFVKWTEEEKVEIADRVFELFMKHPDYSIITCLKKVNYQLSESRRREINTLSLVPWLLPAIQQRVHDLNVRADSVAALKSEITRLSKQIESLTAHRPSAHDILAKASLADLLSVVLPRALAEVTNGSAGIAKRLEAIEAKLVEHTPVIDKKPEVKKIIITILGGYDDWRTKTYERLPADIKQKINLHFYIADEIRDIPESNHVILIADIASHKHHNKFKTATEAQRHYHNGGLTQLVELIKKIVTAA